MQENFLIDGMMDRMNSVAGLRIYPEKKERAFEGTVPSSRPVRHSSRSESKEIDCGVPYEEPDIADLMDKQLDCIGLQEARMSTR